MDHAELEAEGGEEGALELFGKGLAEEAEADGVEKEKGCEGEEGVEEDKDGEGGGEEGEIDLWGEEGSVWGEILSEGGRFRTIILHRCLSTSLALSADPFLVPMRIEPGRFDTVKHSFSEGIP